MLDFSDQTGNDLITKVKQCWDRIVMGRVTNQMAIVRRELLKGVPASCVQERRRLSYSACLRKLSQNALGK
jgi:hypothetical protein